MRRVGGLTALLLVAACAAPPAPPAPAASPPSSLPPPPPSALDWRDLPLSPGDWSYADAVATFAWDGVVLLRLRCDRAARVVEIEQPRGIAGAMKLITSYGATDLPAPQGALARVPAGDPLLDRIAFSRGRFSVQASGAPQLVVPSWAEVTRVIEECRS